MSNVTTVTIGGRVPVIHESRSLRECFIHSIDSNRYLDGKGRWRSRPMHLSDEDSWSTREAAQAFIDANADAQPASEPANNHIDVDFLNWLSKFSDKLSINERTEIAERAAQFAACE